MEQTRQRSRKGCLTCREKRKKCDEVRPICGRCRGGDDCIWPASQLASKVASRPSRLPRIQPRPSLDPRPIYTNVISDEASTTASEDSKTASSVSPHESNLNSLDMFPEMAAGPDFHELSAYCLFSASDLLPEFNDSPPVSIDNFWDHGSSLTRNYRIHLSSNSFALACDSEDGPDYALDEDEEETFKTNEWLPGTLQSIKLHLSLNVPSQDGIPWSSIVESYFSSFVRYSYDPTHLPVHMTNYVAHHHQVESMRLGMLGSSLLFHSFLKPGLSQNYLRKHAYEFISAAGTALQIEMAQPNTTLNAQLAGMSEILCFYYYAGDLGGYMQYISRAAPLVQRLMGTAPVSIHKLYGLETLDIRLFILSDIFSAMSAPRSTWLIYDCNADALLSRNQKGPDPPHLDVGLEWVCGLPDAFLLLTIQILNLKHASLAERLARAPTIEAALRAWKIWPSSITSSTMRIQRASAQEIWRHSTILYLYHVVYRATSSHEVVQQSVKQIIKLASMLRPGHNPDCLLHIPYFLAGTFAISAKDKQFIRSRLMACALDTYVRAFVNALDELWQQFPTDEYVDWSSRSPPLVVF